MFVSNTAESSGVAKLKLTMLYVFLGIIVATGGAALSYIYAASLTGPMFIGLIVIEFILLFAFMFWKNIFTYMAFTFVTGLTLGPVISVYVAAGSGAAVLKALISTAVITGGLTLYAATTKKDYLSWGPALFWILLGLIVVMILNLFVASSVLSTIISMIGVLLFSAFIVHDVQEAMRTDIDPLMAAMGIYLDILNLFLHLLQLFGLGADD